MLEAEGIHCTCVFAMCACNGFGYGLLKWMCCLPENNTQKETKKRKIEKKYERERAGETESLHIVIIMVNSFEI